MDTFQLNIKIKPKPNYVLKTQMTHDTAHYGGFTMPALNVVRNEKYNVDYNNHSKGLYMIHSKGRAYKSCMYCKCIDMDECG
jgi:hypothetical protein